MNDELKLAADAARQAGALILKHYAASDQEVRTWMIRQGSTAVEAADGIHTDFARGFIRAERMTCANLFRLGSERNVKAANLLYREPKNYVIQDGDILYILSNV